MSTQLKKTAYVEIRSQKSVGSGRGKFGGPDTYVCVQIVPEGVEPLRTLNQAVANKRGIELVHCGEGYCKSDGPQSKLGQAIAKANEIAAKINE